MKRNNVNDKHDAWRWYRYFQYNRTPQIYRVYNNSVKETMEVFINQTLKREWHHNTE